MREDYSPQWFWKKLTGRVKRYSRFLLVTLLMVAIRLGLRWVQLPKLLHWLSVLPRSPVQNHQDFKELAYCTDRVLKVFPYNAKGNCLPRSLILYTMAPVFGLQVKFHCGVRKGGSGLDGHAWLTQNGEPILEFTQQRVGMIETFIYPESEYRQHG